MSTKIRSFWVTTVIKEFKGKTKSSGSISPLPFFSFIQFLRRRFSCTRFSRSRLQQYHSFSYGSERRVTRFKTRVGVQASKVTIVTLNTHIHLTPVFNRHIFIETLPLLEKNTQTMLSPSENVNHRRRERSFHWSVKVLKDIVL